MDESEKLQRIVEAPMKLKGRFGEKIKGTPRDHLVKTKKAASRKLQAAGVLRGR